MKSLTDQSSNQCYRAAQWLIAMLSVLLLGHLIAWVPVMSQLELFRSFKAGEVVRLCSETAALVLFFFFVRYSVQAMPGQGGFIAFFKAIAEPIAILVIAILGQALLWRLIDPFVGTTGRTVYYGTAIALIVAISAWLVWVAYQNAGDVVDAAGKTVSFAKFLFKKSGRKVICGQCGAEISSDAKYCGQCGHERPETLSCSACGKELSAGQNYCQYCGAETPFHYNEREKGK